jgi:radical SAM superfamily enzyme YgiQ (UPF0313 family)
MKVLLIQPPLNPNIIGAGIIYLNEPLALETVAAAIPHHEVRILDMRLGPNLKQELNAFQPDIVGVTAYTPDVYTAGNILKKVKEYNENIFTVVGGQHATLLPEDFHKEFIDAVVIGEGYHSFQELVDTYEKKGDLAKIEGLALSQNGRLLFTTPRGLTSNLDEMPLPQRNLNKGNRNKYFRGTWRPVASIMTSRGCPYRCNFCSVWKHENGKYRAQSAERVVDELMTIEEKFISISDDNFMQDLKRAERIYKLIKNQGIEKMYKLSGRSDIIVRRPDIIEKWKEIGMKLMLIGLESFRDEDLKSLNKQNTVRNNEEAIRILHENGVEVVAYFIVNPDYTEEDFKALAEYIERMKLRHPIFTVLTPLPGTDLYEEKRDELLTHNYELFDYIHSVLPTKLPRKEFYQYFADLYRKSYSLNKIGGGSSPVSEKILQQIYSCLTKADKL